MKFLSLLARGTGKFVLKYFEKGNSTPLQTQLDLLSNIIKHNKTTKFGKKHNFDEIRSVRDFQKRVQVSDYEYIRPYIQETINGNKSALTNSKILFWGQTSGTSGTPKLIPITKHVIDTFNSMSFRIFLNYIQDFPEKAGFLDGKWFLLPGFPLLRYEKDGKPVGFITGIIMHPFGIYYWKKFLSPFYYYPLKYLSIQDAETRFKKIAADIRNKNVTYAMGVTSVLINLLEKIVKYNGANNLLEILPNFRFTLFSGGSTRNYIDKFYKIVGKKIDVREGYFATEGSFAIQKHEKPVMEFAYDSCFYEFLPVSNGQSSSERLLINQLEKNKQYSLVISCYNGLYAYNMKDIVKIVSIDPVEIVFAHREGVIDLADEKLTPNEIYTSITDACKKFACGYTDFSVIGTFNPKPHYIFLFEFKEKETPKDYQSFLNEIDKNLQELNEVYYFNIAGPNKGALIQPELWVLKLGAFSKAQEKKMDETGNIGQIKIPRYTTKEKNLGYFEGEIEDKIYL
jgi:hypothetical protein